MWRFSFVHFIYVWNSQGQGWEALGAVSSLTTSFDVCHFNCGRPGTPCHNTFHFGHPVSHAQVGKSQNSTTSGTNRDRTCEFMCTSYISNSLSFPFFTVRSGSYRGKKKTDLMSCSRTHQQGKLLLTQWLKNHLSTQAGFVVCSTAWRWIKK